MLWLDSTHLQRSASQTAARCHRCGLPPGQWSRRPEHTIWQTDQFRPLRGTIHKTTWSHASPFCVSLAADSNNQSFRSYPASGGGNPHHLTGSDSVHCSCCPSQSIKAAATQDDQRERDRLPKKVILTFLSAFQWQLQLHWDESLHSVRVPEGETTLSITYQSFRNHQPAVCWPPACGSTADCDPQSSRDRPDGPEHMSETCPWTDERPNPTAHLCDPEHITNST